MSKRVVFADTPDGRLYVKVKAVMHPLVAMIDGLTVTYFGKGKTAYLAIDDAIEWCRKEAKHHSAEEYSRMICVMERAKAQQQAQVDAQ